MAQNIWQFLILRALLGLLGGYSQRQCAHRHSGAAPQSGWALDALYWRRQRRFCLAPHAGGLLADALRPSPGLLLPPACCFICFLLTFFFYSREFPAGEQKKMLHVREVVASLKFTHGVKLFVTTLIIQVATGSVRPS